MVNFAKLTRIESFFINNVRHTKNICDSGMCNDRGTFLSRKLTFLCCKNASNTKDSGGSGNFTEAHLTAAEQSETAPGE